MVRKKLEAQESGQGILSELPSVNALTERLSDLDEERLRVKRLLECLRAMQAVPPEDLPL